MSENNQVPAEPQVAEVEAQAETPAPEVSTELFEVHGKKFDISTPQGKGELKGFLEAMSSELGRKNNEVGTLRKFAAAVKPDSSESELIAKARARAAEGNIDEAIDQVFSYSKAKVREIERRQEVERDNNETWDDYLSARPDLTKLFDRKTIRQVSESTLPIHENEKAFEILDSFWMPKVKALTTVAAQPQAPAVKDKPPMTLSGGQPAKQVAPNAVSKSAPSAEAKPSWMDILDSSSKPFRRSVK